MIEKQDIVNVLNILNEIVSESISRVEDVYSVAMNYDSSEFFSSILLIHRYLSSGARAK